MRMVSVTRPAYRALGHEKHAFWSADHFIKQGMQVVQRPRERTLLKTAPPHGQGQTLERKPRVGIEPVRSGKLLDPRMGIGEGPNRGRGLEGDGVEGDGHGRRGLNTTNEHSHSAKDLRSEFSAKKISGTAQAPLATPRQCGPETPGGIRPLRPARGPR